MKVLVFNCRKVLEINCRKMMVFTCFLHPDPSETFKVYAKAYNWAYGDVFDRIHKENPDVDIYVRSPGTPENHNFQMRNNRTSLVISTDEIKLLQSKKESDKDAQETLWNTILEKIRV